ncbi:tripartite tricarboxylate transporter TctB family protein [Bosea sp. (in: a-proteobacteria)]|uniref:tripartite tricarboxylate transporter TctB family protein n=1 Tax=Bosea sp. (in: a-proteobacteria) TaxID=1871050 RepID=UPI003F707BF2
MAFTLNKRALSSLLFILIGGGFAAVSWLQHPLGTAASMGRGFFPFWVGLTLAVLGSLGLIRSQGLSADGEIAIAWRPFIHIIGAVLVFAILLPEGGLYLASLAGTLLASRADRGFPIGAALLLGLGLAMAAHLAFVFGLSLPIRALPSVFSV